MSGRKRRKKNRKIFSRSSNNSKQRNGREAQTFFINNTKSRKSQATKVDDDGTYREFLLAFGLLHFFFGFLFFMISQHTHTTHTYTYTYALRERWREADQVLKVVLMLMTFHYATTGVRYPVDKLLNIFYATATHPLPPGPQHKHPSNGHPWTMQWCCYSHFIIPLLVPN